jgi:hypothetical protein
LEFETLDFSTGDCIILEVVTSHYFFEKVDSSNSKRKIYKAKFYKFLRKNFFECIQTYYSMCITTGSIFLIFYVIGKFILLIQENILVLTVPARSQQLAAVLNTFIICTVLSFLRKKANEVASTAVTQFIL